MPHVLLVDDEEPIRESLPYTLRREGYDFSPEWYDAQRQFRFPLYRSVTHSGVTLELRHALEP